MRSVKCVIVPPVAVPPLPLALRRQFFLALAILATAVSFAPIPDGVMSAQLDGRGPHGRYYRVGAVQPWLRYAHIWDPSGRYAHGGRIEHFDGSRSAAHLVLVSLVWGVAILLWRWDTALSVWGERRFLLAVAISATAVSFAPIPDRTWTWTSSPGPHYRVGAVLPWLQVADAWENDATGGDDGGRETVRLNPLRFTAHLVLVSLVWGSVIVLWPRGDRERFQALAKTLQEQLSGVKVYKVGAEAERQVHVVGKAPDGRLLARDDEARPVARPPTEGALAGGAPGPKPTQAGL